jgi:hypothetical protein
MAAGGGGRIGGGGGVGAPRGLSMIAAIRGYIDKMIRPREKEQEVTGMKVLIVDKETVRGVAGWLGGMGGGRCGACAARNRASLCASF